METMLGVHKPEKMHYGRCPECERLKICVLLYVGDGTGTRRYHIRKHGCGKRLLPVSGSVHEVRNSPESTGGRR